MRKWLIKIIAEALLENDMRLHTQIKAARDPNEHDCTGSTGSIWINVLTKEKFVLKNIRCNWKKIANG